MLPLRGLSGFIICLATDNTPLMGLIALSNGPHPQPLSLKERGVRIEITFVVKRRGRDLFVEIFIIEGV